MVDSYFDALTKRRLVLSWSVATRLQLDRWEALVAANLRNELYDKLRSAGALIWQAQFEHHFLSDCSALQLHLY